jgi:methionine-rich copper-binding protein CopC
MLRLVTLTAALALAGPAVAQDPHGAHAGMQPAGHAGMDHSQHAAAAQSAQGVTTTPADGAMLMTPPAEFSVTFPHPMRLSGVTVQAQGQAAVEVVVPELEVSSTASVALPPLSPDTYTLTWTAIGADGHEMSGSIEFMVH